MRSIEPGNYLHIHDIDLEAESLLIVNVEVVSQSDRFRDCMSLNFVTGLISQSCKQAMYESGVFEVLLKFQLFPLMYLLHYSSRTKNP